MTWGNRIPYTQKQICEEMGLNKSTVSTSFKRLKNAGVLLVDTRVMGRVVYRISENYAVKGKRELQGTQKLVDDVIAKTESKKSLKLLQGGKP